MQVLVREIKLGKGGGPIKTEFFSLAQTRQDRFTKKINPTFDGGDNQVFLVPERGIKPAAREPGISHHLINGNIFIADRFEKLGRRADDFLPRLWLVVRAVRHALAPIGVAGNNARTFL